MSSSTFDLGLIMPDVVDNILVHQVDTTRLYDHILQTCLGDPPVMEVSNVVTGSSFGVLDPVMKTKPQ